MCELFKNFKLSILLVINLLSFLSK